MNHVRTRTTRGRAGLAGAVVSVLLGLLIAVPAARAEGTGVNFTALDAPVTIPAKEARLLAAEEAACQKWLAERGGDGSVTIQAVDTPCYCLLTPSHKQKNGYYCGPATCQIIDDCWGDCVSQDEYAARYGMCPDSNGTIYSLMDDVLRYYTGKKYNYYSGINSSDDFYNRVQYGLYTKHYPESVVSTTPSTRRTTTRTAGARTATTRTVAASSGRGSTRLLPTR